MRDDGHALEGEEALLRARSCSRHSPSDRPCCRSPGGRGWRSGTGFQRSAWATAREAVRARRSRARCGHRTSRPHRAAAPSPRARAAGRRSAPTGDRAASRAVSAGPPDSRAVPGRWSPSRLGFSTASPPARRLSRDAAANSVSRYSTIDTPELRAGDENRPERGGEDAEADHAASQVGQPRLQLRAGERGVGARHRGAADVGHEPLDIPVLLKLLPARRAVGDVLLHEKCGSRTRFSGRHCHQIGLDLTAGRRCRHHPLGSVWAMAMSSRPRRIFFKA